MISTTETMLASAVAERPPIVLHIKKGLKGNAISFLSNVVIGVSSTSPAYSLASTLGLIAGCAAFFTPAIMIVAFIPMLFIAVACYHMNRVDPDCGTTFSWVTRAMGPHAGWIGGWSIIVTDILVMPSLATIASKYSFQLFDYNDPPPFEVTLVGVTWIFLMTAICYMKIELSARTQQLLLGAELAILGIFVVVALAKVYAGSAPTVSQQVSANWFNPLDVDGLENFTKAVVFALFIYWGWDTGVAINEETENPDMAPGQAAVVSTIVLVATYVLVAVAAIAFAGPDVLAQNKNDVLAAVGRSVLSSPFDKLLVIAVLTSTMASTQTSILPTARMAVSMACAGAIPKVFAKIHPRYLSPSFATLATGAISIAWYVGLTFVSQNVLSDSVLAIGLVIAFYYALTAFACVIFFRRELFKSARNFVFIGILPTAGGLTMSALFIRSLVYLGRESAGSMVISGIGGPLVIGVGSLLVGLILMTLSQRTSPDFFRRKTEVVDAVVKI